MSFENLLFSIAGYSIQFALLVGLAFLAMFLTRTKHPVSNLYFWQSVLGLALILPFLDSVVKVSSPVFDPIFNFEVEASVSPVSGSESFFLWAPLLLFVLLAGIIFNLGKLTLGLLRLRTINKAADIVNPLPENLVRLKKRLHKHCSIKISREIGAPLTFGFLNPVILIPEKFRFLDNEQQECVICHELLHISRRDWLLNLSEQTIKSVLWFHPAIYFLITEITLSREKLIDARVVGITGKRKVYLKALWRMIQPDPEVGLYPVVPFAGRSQLLKRISILSLEFKMPREQFGKQLITTAISFLLVMILTITVGQSVSPLHFENIFPPAADSSSVKDVATENPAIQAGEDPLQLDKNEWPELVKRVNPKYPEKAKKAGISGVVRCSVLVDKRGIVQKVEIIRSPDDILSKATAEALKQWVYEPTFRGGKAVEVSFIVTFYFVPQ